MSSFKQEVAVSQFVDEIGTKLQRLYLYIQLPANQSDNQVCFTTKPQGYMYEIKNGVFQT